MYRFFRFRALACQDRAEKAGPSPSLFRRPWIALWSAFCQEAPSTGVEEGGIPAVASEPLGRLCIGAEKQADPEAAIVWYVHLCELTILNHSTKYPRILLQCFGP